jgi:hypothetical protein
MTDLRYKLFADENIQASYSESPYPPTGVILSVFDNGIMPRIDGLDRDMSR